MVINSKCSPEFIKKKKGKKKMSGRNYIIQFHSCVSFLFACV